jgi:hypothetical protein
MPAVKTATRIDHLIEFEREHEQKLIKYRRNIKLQFIFMEGMVLLCMALAIGGLVIRMMLLWR